MSFERARAIADAVLLEGYVLYPYRASSAKNQYRWTFGVVAPRAWSEAGGSDPWWLESQVLVRQGARGSAHRSSAERPRLRARLRYMQVVARRIEALEEGRFVATSSLEVDGERFLPFEEGELREHDVAIDGDLEVRFEAPAGDEASPILDASGAEVGRVVRTRAAISGVIRVRVEPLSGASRLTRVSVRVENLTPHAPGVARADAMRASLTSAHLLIACEGSTFVSLQDPPEDARAAAAACKGTGSYPVLCGAPGQDDLVLSAPIILEDHPRIAPESPGEFFDSAEIDELLVLRTKTLTPDEKLAARATDPRARALLDRVEALDPEAMSRLHGAVRERSAPPRVAPGARVLLRLGRSGRRTDAQDMLFDGCAARVEAILQDVDGREYVAVTLDDDPAADLHRAKGRFSHYRLDEVELLDDESAS